MTSSPSPREFSTSSSVSAAAMSWLPPTMRSGPPLTLPVKTPAYCIPRRHGADPSRRRHKAARWTARARAHLARCSAARHARGSAVCAEAHDNLRMAGRWRVYLHNGFEVKTLPSPQPPAHSPTDSMVPCTTRDQVDDFDVVVFSK